VKTKYLVAISIEIDGQIYGVGSTVELDLETAALYAHALRAVEDGEEK
jgi:hypothetical protein